MATIVTLRTVWLGATDDPTDVRAFRFMSSLTRSTSQPVEIQPTASGGRRVVRMAGLDRSWSIALPACDEDQIAWLEAHLGVTMCARDNRGHKVFGLFSSVDAAAKSLRAEDDTSLDFPAITYSEVV